jgi:hypothetical protein
MSQIIGKNLYKSGIYFKKLLTAKIPEFTKLEK